MAEEQCVAGFTRCTAPPRWSVSEHLDQPTDRRVCGRHLTWLVSRLNDQGHGCVVVARLVSEEVVRSRG